MPNGSKDKIGILGGGMSSLTTAFELTNKTGWEDKYDITVYQLGWRQGGKGASGRGLHEGIEEHGLHIWIGFYENAFRLIRMAYKEMVERGLCPPNCPMTTFEQAFKKHSLIMAEEPTEHGFKPWVFPCPTNDSVPGDPLPGDPNQNVNPEFPTPEDYFSMLIQIIHSLFRATPNIPGKPGDGCLTGWLKKAEVGIEAMGTEAAWQLLEAATGLAAKLSKTPDAHKADEHPEMVVQFEKLIAWLRS